MTEDRIRKGEVEAYRNKVIEQVRQAKEREREEKEAEYRAEVQKAKEQYLHEKPKEEPQNYERIVIYKRKVKNKPRVTGRVNRGIERAIKTYEGIRKEYRFVGGGRRRRMRAIHLTRDQLRNALLRERIAQLRARAGRTRFERAKAQQSEFQRTFCDSYPVTQQVEREVMGVNTIGIPNVWQSMENEIGMHSRAGDVGSYPFQSVRLDSLAHARAIDFKPTFLLQLETEKHSNILP